ncbi:ribosomal protein S18 [Clohesyomyces aquaticus]|uniref:Small ribosomal subunit protein bS18m n=1 Tax=Clohesyomyces aquaticus TaxID=1231657 RepID=A0A1Y1ZQS0_9PLEO|nr:ribosomal protein S18 [Clohesyomyces aquaticus]
MSLPRLPIRPSTRLASQCLRGFSSASRRREEDIFGILAQISKTRSHPSNVTPPPTAKPAPSPRFEQAHQMLPTTRTTSSEADKSARIDAFSRQVHRRWKAGDVYAPHDLSGPEQKKWKFGRQTPQTDAFDTLGIDPVNEYKNFTMMSEYMTEMGRIKHSSQTGLRPVNQRKIAKAIRRAIGLGLMPSVHRHPLVLKRSNPARFL